MFINRVDAGRRLALRLEHLRGQDLVVVGLPRGGVPVAAEVAQALAAPLDVIIVRKIGVPWQPELGMGAVGEDGARVINLDVVRIASVSEKDLVAVEKREVVEVERRAKQFRGDRARIPLAGKTVVVIDDGIATGSTAKAACQIARARGAKRVVLAVPVAPADWNERMIDDADELVCVETPENFLGVGQWYSDFSQTTDDEVLLCLRRSLTVSPTSGSSAPNTNQIKPKQADTMHTQNAPRGNSPADNTEANNRHTYEGEIEVPIGSLVLRGQLVIPERAGGIVIFAHGSGSNRHSPRNRFVAGVMHRARLGTLLVDLLTVEEEGDRSNVFDVELLGDRLIDVTRWLRHQPEANLMPLGYFGASTGAAAALWAAGDPFNNVDAVVSRGGRPDLTGPRLAAVTAHTLLIVGGNDEIVLKYNCEAQQHLHCENDLTVIPGATHLFEEDGALLEVSELARDWFMEHFSKGPVTA